MKVVGIPEMKIKDSSGIQEFTYELSHFISLPERMKVKVTIEVVPMIGF